MKTLKDIRYEKGISQKAIAEQIGIKSSALSLKEKGKRKFTALEVQKLCVIYGIDIKDIKLD